jgi:hypothetical protein
MANAEQLATLSELEDATLQRDALLRLLWPHQIKLFPVGFEAECGGQFPDREQHRLTAGKLRWVRINEFRASR